MLIKILIDVDMGSRQPVIRITDPRKSSESDDVKDRLVSGLLEDVSSGTGLMAPFYADRGDSQDVLLAPCDIFYALDRLLAAYTEDDVVAGALRTAYDEIHKELSGKPQV